MGDYSTLIVLFVVFVIIGIIRIIRAVIVQNELRYGMQYGVSDIVKQKKPMPEIPTAWNRFQAGWRRAFGSRAARQYEFRNRFHPGSWDLETIFFCPRLPLSVTITLDSEKVPAVKAVSINRGEGFVPTFFTYKVSSEPRLHTITVRVYLAEAVDAISVALADTDDDFEYRCGCKFEVRSEADYLILREAYQYIQDGRAEAALRYFEKYDSFSKANPWVSSLRARYFFDKKDYRLAKHYALMALVYGQMQVGSDVYGAAKEKLGFDTTREEIEQLVNRESAWGLDANFGFSVLRESHEVLCGLNGFHLVRQHQIFRVRRSAAARLIRQVHFDITPQSQLLLHSSLRILRANGEETKLGRDNLIFADSDSRNAAITTKEEKQGVWILPDLYSGDVVEWTVDILTHDRVDEDESRTFDMIALFNNSYPTVEGRIDVYAYEDFEAAFFQTHPDVVTTTTDEQSDGVRRYHFFGKNYFPLRNSGFDYGGLFLNPRIAIATAGCTWKMVAESIRQQLLGKDADADKLPEDVRKILDSHDTDRERLEAVFYWIRDKLKYGVFQKAHEMIGKEGRADAIVKSGFADCKDRSYLLYVTCRELGLECNFYMTSAKYGSAIQELPADQFDHVSLRAKIDDKWYYLDPTNAECLFGSVPFWYQGMKSLIVDDEGTVITLPEDEPQQNLLVIREVIDHVEDGWVAGSFFIRSRGQTARLFEEHWKARTLSNDRRLVAAQQSIEAFMPRAIIDRFDQLASTSEGDTFTVSGVCRRARCDAVGDQRVAAIEWGIPILPVEYWRGFEFANMYGFRFPLVVEIDIEIANSLAHVFREHSRIDEFRGAGLGITEHCERRGESIAVHRTITIEHKFIRGEAVKTELPKFFEALEKALGLTCVFER